MAKFLVQFPDALNKVNGVNAMVVEADSAAIAKRLCAAQVGSDADWVAATATDLTAAFAADFTGFTYRIRIGAAPDAVGADIVDVSYVGVASDTVDLIGAALVTALNATAQIAGAAYNTSTNVLTIAETTDALGDHSVNVETIPNGAGGSLSDLFSTVVHQGASGDALKVTLVAPTAIPAVLAKL